jgi:hypothetical protein
VSGPEDGTFQIALSATESDLTTNVEALRQKDYFLLPVVYQTGRHATIFFRKGKAGSKIFKKALRSWYGKSS